MSIREPLLLHWISWVPLSSRVAFATLFPPFYSYIFRDVIEYRKVNKCHSSVIVWIKCAKVNQYVMVDKKSRERCKISTKITTETAIFYNNMIDFGLILQRNKQFNSKRMIRCACVKFVYIYGHYRWMWILLNVSETCETVRAVSNKKIDESKNEKTNDEFTKENGRTLDRKSGMKKFIDYNLSHIAPFHLVDTNRYLT